MLKGTPSQILSTLTADDQQLNTLEAPDNLEALGSLFDNILEGISGGFWRFDCTSGKLQWSEGLYKMFGLDPKDGIDSSRFQELIVPEERDEVRQHLVDFIQTGGHFKDEFRMQQADGTIIHIQSVGTCLENNMDGSPCILAGFTTGVIDTRTNLALKELNLKLQVKVQELELAEARLGVALKGEPLCLYIQDQDLKFVWAYKIAERFGGMAALGKTDLEIGLPKKQSENTLAMKREVVETHITKESEGWVKDIHGEDRYVTLRFAPYQFPDERWGLIGKVYDLTEQKRSEETVIKQTEELKGLTQRLEQEKQDLTEALNKLSKEHKRKHDELSEARELQNSLLPSGKINFSGFTIATHTATSVEVGGDYYDFCPLEDGGMVLAVGDATGHGLRSGIIVAMVKSYFQLLASQLDPVDMLERISTNLRGMRLQKMYMGLLVMKYDGKDFSLASAGMPPVLIYRAASGIVESISQPNIFLGTHISLKKDTAQFVLASGDMIVAMSDGLTEAMNERGEMISPADILDTVKRFGPSGSQATIDALVALQAQWTGTTVLRDDTTLVAASMD